MTQQRRHHTFTRNTYGSQSNKRPRQRGTFATREGDRPEEAMREGQRGLLRKSVSSRPLAETRRTSSFPCTMFAAGACTPPRSPAGCSFLMRCSCRGRYSEGQRRRHFPLGWQPNQSKCDMIYMERKVMAHTVIIMGRSHAVAARSAPAWINHACQSASHM